MRKQTAKDLAEIREQEDMLKGNINRMCVTKDMTEYIKQKNLAIYRIGVIADINYRRLTESEEQHEKFKAVICRT